MIGEIILRLWNQHVLSTRLTRRKSLLIIVKSAPHRLQNIYAIRATWGKTKQFGNIIV
jgi:hypothetical protein